MEKRSGCAFWALGCSIIGWLAIFDIVQPVFVIGLVGGVVLGHYALRQINKLPSVHGGGGEAIAGLILGYIGIGLMLILFLVGFFFAKLLHGEYGVN